MKDTIQTQATITEANILATNTFDINVDDKSPQKVNVPDCPLILAQKNSQATITEANTLATNTFNINTDNSQDPKSKRHLEEVKIKENPTATPVQTVIAKTFVPITCRGSNTNSDSCFFYPVCKSLKCGGKRVNCNYQKKWTQIVSQVSEETTSVISKDRLTSCPYFPLCESSQCGGQGGMGICNNYLKWKRVIENEDDFLLVDKVDAKKTQKAARAAAKRAQKRQEKNDRAK